MDNNQIEFQGVGQYDHQSTDYESNPIYPQQEQQHIYEKNDHESSLSLSSDKLRAGFIKKVYGIIAAQLAITAVFINYSLKSYEFAKFQQNSGFYWLAFLGAIIPQIIILCSKTQARKTPNNYILLLIFTLSFSYTASAQCSLLAWTADGKADVEGQQLIWIAALMTAGITIALSCYAFTTSKDYTVNGGMLFVALFGLILFGLIATLSGIQFLYSVYLWLSVTIYGMYLVYDTQLLCENKSRNLTLDDYIIGAMIIYTDIIIMFLRILRILAQSKKR